MNGLLRLCLCVGSVALIALGAEKAEDTPPAPAPAGEHQADDKDGPETDHLGDDNGEMKEEVEEEETKVALPAEAEQMTALFEKIDTDKDGKMSMPEIIAFWKITRKGMLHQNNAQDMELMDTNKDKKVSLEEFIKEEEEQELEVEKETGDARRKAFRELETAKFKAADKNSDGFLDEHELPDAVYGETHDEIVRIMAAHHLKSKDTNGDGKLNEKEFHELGEDPKVGEEIKATEGAEAGKVEEKDAKMAEEEAESDKESAEEFKKQDTDGDGQLNLEELVHYESGVFHMTLDMKTLFEACDGDKDSHITLKELTDNLHSIDGSAANDHLNEWSEHHDSMMEHHGEL
jgi:Ca2+-binding EF-hand superfamily protein